MMNVKNLTPEEESIQEARSWVSKLWPDKWRVRLTTVEKITNDQVKAIQVALREMRDWESSESARKDRELQALRSGHSGSAYGSVSIFEDIEAHKVSRQVKNKDGELGDVKEETIRTEVQGRKRRSANQRLAEGIDSTTLGWNLTSANPDNYQTLEELREFQDASIDQYLHNPVARSIVENYKRYVLGRGVKIGCNQPEVEQFLKKFWILNRMEKQMKLAFRDYPLEGEIFFAFFEHDVDATGFDKEYDTPIKVRRFASEQITEVEYDPDDYMTPLSFCRETSAPGVSDEDRKKYYLHIWHPRDEDQEGFRLPYNDNASTSKFKGKAEDDVYMSIIKYGRTFDPRGRVFMEPVLRWNRMYVDFIYDRGRLNHLRSKIFLVKTVAKKASMSDYDSIEKMPRGGMMLLETQDRKYRVIAPETGASDATEDAKLLMYIIAAGVTMPAHVLMQNAENNNYASINKADHPFVQAVTDFQDDWTEDIQEILRYVIATGVRKGLLEPTYTLTVYPGDNIGEARRYIVDQLLKGRNKVEVFKEAEGILDGEDMEFRTVDLPIDVTFPQMISEDPKAQAEAIAIDFTNGFVSVETARQIRGYDHDLEEARMDQAREKKLAQQEEEDERARKNGSPFNTPEEDTGDEEDGDEEDSNDDNEEQ